MENKKRKAENIEENDDVTFSFFFFSFQELFLRNKPMICKCLSKKQKYMIDKSDYGELKHNKGLFLYSNHKHICKN